MQKTYGILIQGDVAQSDFLGRISPSESAFNRFSPIFSYSDKFSIAGDSWHNTTPIVNKDVYKGTFSPRLSGIGMPSPIFWSHQLKM